MASIRQAAPIFREPWIYIENAITKECIWASTQFTREGIKLNVSASLRNRLETGTEQLQALFQKEFNSLSDKERSVMHALHWLRWARDEDTETNKLMYLWNTIEFLCAASKAPRLFSKEERESISKLTCGIISDSDPSKERKLDRLQWLVSDLNNPSIRLKLEALVQIEGIAISEKEWALIKLSREKRNDLIHGKSDVHFSENDATKLSFIVSKIISGISRRL